MDRNMRSRLFGQTFLAGMTTAGTLAIAAGSIVFGGQEASAQTPAAAATASKETVIITGSRIARQDYTANSPIVTVGSEELSQTGSPSVDVLINQLPQFTPAVTSTSNNPGGSGQANISLRGLGTNRTLVLMDGQRITPSNRDGTVDVNIIPAPLVQSIEVVTGGQSAAYGSDAIAGVVNFKLKKNFEGAQFGFQYGGNEVGDGEEYSANATLGGNFADKKGNAVMAFTYTNRQAIFNKSRPFSAVSGASGTTPYGQADIGSTVSLAAANTLFGGRYAGTTALTSVPNFGFNNDGTLFTGGVANAQNYKGDTTSIDYSTIKTKGTYNTGPLNELSLPLDRYTVYSRVAYDFNRYFHAAVDANFVNYQSDSILAPSPASNNPGTGSFPGTGGTGFLVPYNNPFVSTDLATLLASRASPTSPFLIRYRFSNVGPRQSHNEYTWYQMGTDVGGDITDNIRWSVHASYGREQRIETQFGNVSHAAVRQLLEAADGGASLCTGGFNFMGNKALSASCIAFISRITKNQSINEEKNIVADVQGSLFKLPAGDVLFDIGTSYRSEDAGFLPDSVLSVPDISNTASTVTNGLKNNAPGVVGFNGQGAVSAFIDVKEVFGELVVPVLKDLPMAQELNFNGSYRYSDYNTTNAINTWKLGADWQPVDIVRVRGGYSKATRAPSISELFSPAANNFPSIGSPGATALTGDPCDTRSSYRLGANAAAVRALCIAQGVPASIVDSFTYGNTQGQAIVGGNSALNPETADTYTIGGVLQPKFDMPLFHRISLSVDYYNIKIQNYISAPDEPTFLKRCFNASGDNSAFSNSNLFCQPVNRDPSSGQLTGFIATNKNLSEVQTTGVDFQFDWGFGLGAVGLPDKWGDITVNVQGTKLDSFKVAALPGDKFVDYKKTIGNTFVSSVEVAHPEWKSATNLVWNVGKLQVGGRWRYIGEMADSGSGKLYAAKSYFDLTSRYNLTENVEFRLGIQNVGDVKPNVLDTSVQANTDPGTYDVQGRRYTAGFTLRY